MTAVALSAPRGLVGVGDAEGMLAEAVAGFLTVVADHWAAVRTAADRSGERRLYAYADAVADDSDATVALVLAVADPGTPAEEIRAARVVRLRAVAARAVLRDVAGLGGTPDPIRAAARALWAVAVRLRPGEATLNTSAVAPVWPATHSWLPGRTSATGKGYRYGRLAALPPAAPLAGALQAAAGVAPAVSLSLPVVVSRKKLS